MKWCIMFVIITTLLCSKIFCLESNIREIDPEIKESSKQFQFCVFGDTRTASDSSLKGSDVVFQFARNRVFEGVCKELKSKRSAFSLFTGDLIWIGGDTSYWRGPKNYFPPKQRKQIFPIPGNHETWNDTTLSNYFDFFNQLNGHHSYCFTHGRSLFISLCTGGYLGEYNKDSSFAQDQRFTCIQSTYEALNLADFIAKKQNEMALKGDTLQNLFLQYHKPSFSFYKHPPLHEDNDPVTVLKRFSLSNKEVQIYVFNGHNHTTEMYKPGDNITVIVAGGGGAPQKCLTPKLVSNSHVIPDSEKLPNEKVKEIYEKKGVTERFWQALGLTTWTRTERVNYWLISVNAQKGDVSITEKVLTFNGDSTFFVDGLRMINGQVAK